MGRSCRLPLLVTALALVGLGRAPAQEMDNDALEALFGVPVTMSATGTPLKVTEAPAMMDIITDDMIRRSGAHNLPDVLAMLAGIDVRRYGGGDAEVNVGGYLQPATPRLLVLVNGRQVYLDDYGRTAWSAIPVQLTEIRRIEVVKGPASALFGFNALSGVINIITYDPLDEPVNRVEVEGGTQSHAGGSVVTTFQPDETMGLRLTAGGWHQREFATAGAPVAGAGGGAGGGPGGGGLSATGLTTAAPEAESLSADGRWRPVPHLEVTLETTLDDSRYTDLNAFGALNRSDFRTESAKGGFTFESDFGTISGTAYHNDLIYGLVTGPNQSIDIQNGVTVGQITDRFKLTPNQTFRLSGEYRQNEVTFQPVSGGPTGTLGYQDYAAAATWDWQILPSVSFINSARVDRLGLYYNGNFLYSSGSTPQDYDRHSLTPLSYNSGVVWRVGPADTLRALAGRSVETPSLLEFSQLGIAPLSLSEDGSGFGQHKAVNLAPSVAAAYTLGWDHNLSALASKTSLSLTYLLLDDVLATSVTNLGRSKTVSLDFEISGAAGGFHWNAGATVRTVSDALLPPTGGLADLTNFQETTPDAIAVVNAGWAGEAIEADLHARWTAEFTDLTAPDGRTLVQTKVPGHLALGGRIAHQMGEHLTLALTGEQLLEARQTVSGGLPDERQVIASATIAW